MSLKSDRSVIRTLVLVALSGFMVASFQNCSPMRAYVVGSEGSNDFSSQSASITDDPVLRATALQVIDAKCGSCHQAGDMGGIDKILEVNHLIATGLVVPGDPNQGRLIGSMTDSTMPPGSPMLPDEIQAVKDWVSSMR